MDPNPDSKGQIYVDQDGSGSTTLVLTLSGPGSENYELDRKGKRSNMPINHFVYTYMVVICTNICM